jgi:hypothetical protein
MRPHLAAQAAPGRPGLPRSVERVAGRRRSRRHGPGSRSAGQLTQTGDAGDVRHPLGADVARRGRPWLTSGRGSTNGMRSPVGDDRTPATAPDSTPVTTKHPPRDGGSVFAARRGERSCRMPPPFCGLHDDDHPAGANAPKSVTRSCTCGTERTSDWGSQVSIEGHLDDDLALVGELLRQNGAGPFVSVPVGVLSTTTVLCNRSSIPRVASHSMVCAVADAPSTHGEDTPISDLPFRPTEQPVAS